MLSKLTANGQPWEFGGLNNSLHCCTHIYFISFKERLLQCPAVESRLADLTEDHNKQKTEMYWLDRGSQMLFVQIWAKFEYTVKKHQESFIHFSNQPGCKIISFFTQKPGKDLTASKIKCSRAFSQPSKAVDKTPFHFSGTPNQVFSVMNLQALSVF